MRESVQVFGAVSSHLVWKCWSLVESHHRWTGSLRARDILDDWDGSLKKFVKVFPHEYQRALKERAQAGAASAGTVEAADTTSMKVGPQPGGTGVLTK